MGLRGSGRDGFLVREEADGMGSSLENGDGVDEAEGFVASFNAAGDAAGIDTAASAFVADLVVLLDAIAMKLELQTFTM